MQVELVKKSENGIIGAVMFEGEEQKACKAYGIKEFKAKNGTPQVVLATLDKKVIFAGLGKKINYTDEALKRAVGKIANTAAQYKPKEITIDATQAAIENSVDEVIEGIALASYAFLKYKPEDAKEKTYVKNLKIVTNKKSADVEKTLTIVNAVNYARDIANEPANVATPEFLAGEAKKTSGKNVSVTVFDKKKLLDLGCNALLAVNAGSIEPPVMVFMDYKPPKFSSTIALVGKGITFDSGGISLKPGKDMDQMKFDKAGACAVIGAVKAISELQFPIRVIGVFAATENLPSGSATKPGDVVKAYNGKTIEILNTDAEGRLILADALSYTVKNYKLDYVVDIATLTGACVVALGNSFTGLTTNNDKFAQTVLEAGEESGDRCWKLPLGTDFDDKIKSDVADIKNLGSPEGAGVLTAAAFLKQFVGSTHWVHLDVAGTAWCTTPRDYYGKGATGVGVRLFVKLCEKLAVQK